MPFLAHAQESLNTSLVYHWSNSELPPSSFHLNTYNEIWGYTAEDREYAIIGSTMGTHIFDITDPANAEEDFFIPGAAQGSNIVHRDYHDYAGYLYAVADEGPSSLQIIDLHDLPGSVNVVYDSNALFSRSHNIFIDDVNAIMYVCGGNHQLDLYSLADPLNPELVLRCQTDIESWSSLVGYIHDIYVKDNIAYCNAGHGLYVVDFSDLENPEFLGDLSGYTEAGYNHSGWLRPDGAYYALADETHGKRVKLIDVADLTDMQIVSFMTTGVDPMSIAHNLIFTDNLLHVSYYHDGYYMWDTEDPINPELKAFFDTSTEVHTSNYRGAWGVYPFLPSGRILVSDMQEGLFVLEVDLGTAVDEIEEQKISAYPNPAKPGERIYLDLHEGRANDRIELWSVTGNLISEQQLRSASGSIGQFELPKDIEAGMYVLRIFANENSKTTKIIVR